MSKTWKVAIASAAAILLAGLAAYASFQARRPGLAPSPPPPAALEKIVIANVGEYSIFNIIAKEEGYFAENGLDAQVDEYDSGATSMGALLAGKADFAVAADFVGVANIFTHKDLRILAKLNNGEVWQVIARRDKGVAIPADLKGKKIGVTKKTSSEYYLGRFLAFNGLRFQDVQVVDLSPPAMIDGLEKGSLDAVVTFEPHGYDLKKELGDTVVAWPAQENQSTSALGYTTLPFIETHPDLVDRYMRSIVEADRYVGAHPAETQAIIGRIRGYDDAYTKYLWTKVRFVLNLNQDMLLAMEDQARWLIENGLTSGKYVPNYLGSIYFEPLEKARPEAVTIIH